MSNTFGGVFARRMICLRWFKGTNADKKEVYQLEAGAQIKKYRNNMKLSQDELAEKIYVSRQTISNWETEKNYPDIHSLLLLSTLFNVSLDQLVKGDVEIMKEEIKETEMKKLNRYGAVFGILLAVTMVSAVPLALWLHVYAIIPWSILFGITTFFCLKVERIKKDNHIHTYKEIVAFSEGRRLDELAQQQEIGKRPYQQFLLAVGSGLITLLVCLLLAWLLKGIM